MVRVTIQPPLISEASQISALNLRNKLLAAVKKADPSLTAIFIIDANPIDTNFVFAYQATTVFDLMYTFIMGTMGLAYLVFIGYVVYKMIEAHQYSKVERANREKEKEMRKIKAASMARAGVISAMDEFNDDEDETEVIDASRWDDVGDDDGDDDQGDAVRDEDGLAVRTLASDVAIMLRSHEQGGSGVNFSPTSRRSAALSQNSKLLADLDRLALPPGRNSDNNNNDESREDDL